MYKFYSTALLAIRPSNLFGLSLALGLTSANLSASLRTWDGGGANNYWLTADNWELNLGPAANDDLLFPSGAARLSNSNNFAAGTTFNSISFYGSGYELRGNFMTTWAGISNYLGMNKISVPVALATNQTFSCEAIAASLIFAGGVDTAGRTLTISSAGDVQFQSGISGTGGIIKTGPQLVTMQANNTYLGATEIREGRFDLWHSNGLGATISGTTVLPEGTVQLSSPMTVAEPLTLAGKIWVKASAIGLTEWSAPITVISNTAVVDFDPNSYPLKISGVISGTGALAKVSSGTLWLTADNTYTGLTSNYFGTLIVDGFQPGSPIWVGLGATLSGNGTVGHVNCAEGSSGQIPKVIPGQVGIGRLTTSNLTANTVAHLGIQLNGTAAGTTYGQIKVRGSVNITNAGLDLTLNPAFKPALGQSFVIIDNDGNDPVQGGFRFRPEGALFNAGGYPFQITYSGGTGNDVVLTRVGSVTTIQSIIPQPNGWMRLQVTGGISGLTYGIQATTNISPPTSWSVIASGVAGANGEFAVFDLQAPSYPMRFYRVASP